MNKGNNTNLEKKNLDFPSKFENIKPKYFLAILGSLLDLLNKAHLSLNREIHLKTLKVLKKIQDFFQNKIEYQLNQILQEDTPYNSKIGMIQVLLHEISQYKKIINKKIPLKFKNKNPIQSPNPTTVKFLLFFTEKEKYLTILLELIHNQQKEKFSKDVNYIRDRVNSVYNKNLNKLKQPDEEKISLISELLLSKNKR